MNELDRLAATAHAEWEVVVATAVLGTDRRPLPAASHGWDAWASALDPAVQLLDRAAAVVAARRAGGRPAPPLELAPPVVLDRRPRCPPDCAARLRRLLRGEHEQLLGEWLDRSRGLDLQLPWDALPALLLRGRRDAPLDLTVRRLAGPRAAWLADAVPELGVRAHPDVPAGTQPLGTVAPSADSGAAVTALVGLFHEGGATWAALVQLRSVVAALDPAWLPALIVELSRLAYHQPTERTRADLLAMADFRLAMTGEFDRASLDTVTP